MPLTTLKTLIEDIKADASDYMRAKIDLMQLKFAEKGSPIAAKGIYATVLLILIRILMPLLLMTSIFALSLIFVSTPEVLEVLRALTFGSLCLFGFFLILLIILMLLRKSIVTDIEGKIINSVIDGQEENEAEALKHIAIPENTSASDEKNIGEV